MRDTCLSTVQMPKLYSPNKQLFHLKSTLKLGEFSNPLYSMDLGNKNKRPSNLTYYPVSLNLCLTPVKNFEHHISSSPYQQFKNESFIGKVQGNTYAKRNLENSIYLDECKSNGKKHFIEVIKLKPDDMNHKEFIRILRNTLSTPSTFNYNHTSNENVTLKEQKRKDANILNLNFSIKKNQEQIRGKLSIKSKNDASLKKGRKQD